MSFFACSFRFSSLVCISLIICGYFCYDLFINWYVPFWINGLLINNVVSEIYISGYLHALTYLQLRRHTCVAANFVLFPDYSIIHTLTQGLAQDKRGQGVSYPVFISPKRITLYENTPNELGTHRRSALLLSKLRHVSVDKKNLNGRYSDWASRKQGRAWVQKLP